MTTVIDASYVSADEWAQWERDREARNREYAALRARPVYPTRRELLAQLEAMRVDAAERTGRLGRRVAELEWLLDRALWALSVGSNDERVA